MEMIAWPVLGVTTVVAGVLAHRHPRAVLVGRWASGALFVLAGALVNLVYVLGDTDYADFAEGSFLPFVRDTWASVVAPDQAFWIGLLIAFEAVVGLLVVTGGRRTQVALVLMMGFHLALMLFGWFFWAWSVPMLVGLGLLLRAERHAPPVSRRPVAQTGSMSHRHA